MAAGARTATPAAHPRGRPGARARAFARERAVDAVGGPPERPRGRAPPGAARDCAAIIPVVDAYKDVHTSRIALILLNKTSLRVRVPHHAKRASPRLRRHTGLRAAVMRARGEVPAFMTGMKL